MTLEDIGTAELALFRSFHDRRLQVAWEIHDWPEVCRTEKRYFRAQWDATKSYALSDERFDLVSGRYFQSLQGANLNHAPTVAGVENAAWWAECKAAYSGQDWVTGLALALGVQVRNPADGEFYQCVSAHTAGVSFDGTKFGILTVFVRRVEYAQVEDDGTARTVIGEFLRGTDRDPRVTTKVVELPFELDELGAVFVQARVSVSFVWLKFRLRRPGLTGSAWDSGTVYTSGRQVYFVDGAGVGNFWTASGTPAAGESPTTTPAKWVVVELPYIFGAYLKEGGYADWLVSDGQEEKAGAHEGLAEGCLELEADKLQRQGGQVRRLRVES